MAINPGLFENWITDRISIDVGQPSAGSTGTFESWITDRRHYDVYVAVGGILWDTDFSDSFTVTTAGLFTYIGLGGIDVDIDCTSTIDKVGGGSDNLCTKIAINGTVQDKTINCTDSTTPASVTSAGIFTLVNGDTIQLFIANTSSTSNINVNQSNMRIKGG